MSKLELSLVLFMVAVTGVCFVQVFRVLSVTQEAVFRVLN